MRHSATAAWRLGLIALAAASALSPAVAPPPRRAGPQLRWRPGCNGSRTARRSSSFWPII
ncbi:MAG: hypothetical protein WDM92_05765 [Caulobacteraceae bacterium]